jgi:hypothetical protein
VLEQGRNPSADLHYIELTVASAGHYLFKKKVNVNKGPLKIELIFSG